MLAIVIPYFKFQFLTATLESLQGQTNQNFSVYIGDDGSPETPIDVVNKYEQHLQMFYYRFNNNLGGKSLVAHWERCIDMVNEEKWLILLGDDDVLGSRCVEEFYNYIEEIENKEVSVVRFSSALIDTYGKLTSEVFTHPKIENSKDFFFRKLKGGTRSSMSEYVFKREKLKKIKFRHFPLAWYSDLLAVLEISNFQKIFTINTATVYVRYSQINISGKRDNLKLKNISTFLFYKNLITINQNHFTKKQKNILYNNLEKAVLQHKKNLKLFGQISMLYLKRLLLKKYFHLLMKYIKG